MSYPCTKCGCCCKRIDKAVDNSGVIDESSEFYFPYKWDETGKCEKLMPDNTCSVYDSRPLICNIDRLINVLNIPINEFYAMNIVACNQMMDEDGIPTILRI